MGTSPLSPPEVSMWSETVLSHPYGSRTDVQADPSNLTAASTIRDPPGVLKRRAVRRGLVDSAPRALPGSRGWQEDARALPCRRRGERRVLSVCAPLLLAAAAGREAPASPPPALTETRQVRGVSPERARAP